MSDKLTLTAMQANPPKQVIIIRKDLKCRRGKEIAQGAHASMGAILAKGKAVKTETGQSSFNIELDPEMEAWLAGKFTKVCVYVNSEAELLELYEKARSAGLNCALIQDSGLTEFNGVLTYTAVAIGPNDPDKINPLTGHLSLY